MTDALRIRIGNQTAFSAGKVTLPFEFAVDRGFDAFEWFPDKKDSGEGWTVRDVPPNLRSWIRQTASAHDITLSVHAPSAANPLNREAEASFRETVDFARDIGAGLFTIHLHTELGVRAYLDAVRPLLRLLSDAGIGLAVENTVYTAAADFADFFHCLRQSGKDAASRVGMCLDLGHANLFRETRNDYLRFVDMLPPEVPIVHVHLHENYGDRDDHLTIFTGPAARDDSGIRAFIGRLKKRNFSGCIILEQWPNPEVLLVEARTRLIEIIGNEQGLPQGKNNDGEGEDLVAKFAEANRRFLSWRKRLDWVLHLLTDERERPTPDLLTYVAVYLRFLGTGEIRCGEDGGHYRPSHHAEISEQLYKKLVALATDDTRFVIRKIYPWLPSFDSDFKRSEPLTLIRDIAHRNDIPRELKQEIKTTLQNKLHRSAGPEDLVVSEALLRRITAPGASYPEAFVSEFRRFHEELKDFFNAGTLRELLFRIIERKEFGDIPPLRRLAVTLDSQGEDGDSLQRLSLLTGIRTAFAGKLRRETGAAGLRLQITDIGLEDHSFVLLSDVINAIEDSLKARREMPWEQALRASLLAAANVRLGGFEPEECTAIEAEINALSSEFDPGTRDHLLRLKASADRCLRLVGLYRDRVLALFPERAERLGRALGVAEYAIRVYAEADIRSHPIFQLSKLASLLLREIRRRALLPFWDVIVPGDAQGILLSGPSLSALPAAHDGPAVALIDRAVGDEEIPPYVTGIFVTSETPLLSHLAVRARQNGTVFIFCGEGERIEEIRTFSGRPITVAAEDGDFLISPAGFSSTGAQGSPCMKKAGVVGPGVEYPEDSLIVLEMISPSTGGGKAYGARRLAELSKLHGSGFAVPGGVVIPFGAMEASLRSNAVLAGEYASLTGEIDRLPRAGQDAHLKKLRGIIMQLSLPDTVLAGITRHFGKGCRLMVRSSSNCEDAEGLAGAGVYDSVANVPLSEAVSAVLRVWASLWNGRALDARRNAGIPHTACRMAVLIQSMMPADVSFIMHTVNPVTGNEDEILIELAAGLGETLASGREPGSPFRVVYRKKAGVTEMLSFASYSFSSRPGRHGGTVRERVDYSTMPFSRDDDLRARLAKRIGKAGAFAERAFGRPQDIEGLVKDGEVCLVQARSQQLAHRSGRKQCPI